MAQKKPKSPKNPEAEYVIRELGGQQVVSKAFGIKQQTVSLWEYRGFPRAWRSLLVTLHPKVFDGVPNSAEVSR